MRCVQTTKNWIVPLTGWADREAVHNHTSARHLNVFRQLVGVRRWRWFMTTTTVNIFLLHQLLVAKALAKTLERLAVLVERARAAQDLERRVDDTHRTVTAPITRRLFRVPGAAVDSLLDFNEGAATTWDLAVKFVGRWRRRNS